MGNFTYTTNLPVSTNSPAIDQPNMTINTNSINSWTQVDHNGFNTSDGSGGSHARVSLDNSSTNPPASLIGSGYETLYSYPIGTPSAGELFMARGTGAEYFQITGPGVPSAAASGKSFIAG